MQGYLGNELTPNGHRLGADALPLAERVVRSLQFLLEFLNVLHVRRKRRSRRRSSLQIVAGVTKTVRWMGDIRSE